MKPTLPKSAFFPPLTGIPGLPPAPDGHLWTFIASSTGHRGSYGVLYLSKDESVIDGAPTGFVAFRVVRKPSKLAATARKMLRTFQIEQMNLQSRIAANERALGLVSGFSDIASGTFMLAHVADPTSPTAAELSLPKLAKGGVIDPSNPLNITLDNGYALPKAAVMTPNQREVLEKLNRGRL